MSGKTRVPYNRIQQAMEDVRRDRYDYFYDRVSGEVIRISVELMSRTLRILYRTPPEEYEKGVEFDSDVRMNITLPDGYDDAIEQSIQVLLDDRRYIRIPERDSDEAFDVMRGFIDTVEEGPLRELLENALDGAGSFGRFKAVLLRDKKVRKHWHGYNAKAMIRVVDRWYVEAVLRGG